MKLSGINLKTFVWLSIMLVACNEEDKPVDEVLPFTRLLEDQTIYSNLLNRDLNYAVLLPDNYENSSDSYPVVYLLHGYGDNQTAWYKYGLIQYYSDLSLAQTGPMIFVMPQAFNTYYVNNYNNRYRYMDFFTEELVPAIDSIFRTKKESSQRAVMGYSMGGYGALILPAKNPDVFSISVPLSMSFRTDEQYLAEPQSVFDNQWGSIFGGSGTSGEERLTDYFKAYSPFHFFNSQDASKFNNLHLFMDCGDDEESLSVTNGALHNLLETLLISHEYRVRDGAHSWDYWHKSIPEALAFISDGFNGLDYPRNPSPVTIETQITQEQYQHESISGLNTTLGVFKPSSYDTSTTLYPVMLVLPDCTEEVGTENTIQILSLLYDKMETGKIPESLVFEIPADSGEFTDETWNQILDQIKTKYRVVPDKEGWVILGNEQGGAVACSLIRDFPELFNGCFLFNANLPDSTVALSGQFYYVDVTDKYNNPSGSYNLYLSLRNQEIDHEYRIRQGEASNQSLLNGINESVYYLSKKLKNN